MKVLKIISFKGMDNEFVSDLARKYANVCEFKNDFPHNWHSVNDGFKEGFKTAIRLIETNDITNDELRIKIDGFYEWLDTLSQEEYDDMSLTEKCENFFFKN